MNQRWGNKGNGYKNQPVYDAILEFGWENIKHYILEENLNLVDAQILEKEYIIKYNSIEKGYNVSEGGGAGGNPWVCIEYNGETYTANEIAELSSQDINGHDVTNRLGRGWEIDRIINQPKDDRGKLYEYKGAWYTLSQLLEYSPIKNLTLQNLSTRINKHGWEVDRALTQPKNVKLQPKGVGEKSFLYNGKLYNSYELWEIRKNLELSSFDITNRINHHGWSIEDAISKPKKSRGKLFEYKGKYYTSHELAELSPLENITYHDITDRLRGGWSIEEALTKPKK